MSTRLRNPPQWHRAPADAQRRETAAGNPSCKTAALGHGSGLGTAGRTSSMPRRQWLAGASRRHCDYKLLDRRALALLGGLQNLELRRWRNTPGSIA